MKVACSITGMFLRLVWRFPEGLLLHMWRSHCPEIMADDSQSRCVAWCEYVISGNVANKEQAVR